jgi:patatin-like phospholipase/acyl hydrolase
MRILSIDGGGLRGIIPGQVLVALEAKLQQLSGDPGRRIADAFDLIAGTSTGGILTCLYLCPDATGSRPKFSAQEAVGLYLDRGGEIFDRSVWQEVTSLGGLADEKYSAAALEKALLGYFGEQRLGGVLKPCLVTAYDIVRRKSHFFNSADVEPGRFGVKLEPKGPGADYLLRHVARATSAAPTYFEPAHIPALDGERYSLIDGGVFANNPAMCACVEAFAMNPELEARDLKILSLGTGVVDKSYPYSKAKDWGQLAWLKPVLDILMSGVAETVDYQLRLLMQGAGCPGQYLRLQLDLKRYPSVDSEMDDGKPQNLAALSKAGAALAAESDAALDAFAKLLLA